MTRILIVVLPLTLSAACTDPCEASRRTCAVHFESAEACGTLERTPIFGPAMVNGHPVAVLDGDDGRCVVFPFDPTPYDEDNRYDPPQGWCQVDLLRDNGRCEEG